MLQSPPLNRGVKLINTRTYDEMLAQAKAVAAKAETRTDFLRELLALGIRFEAVWWDDAEPASAALRQADADVRAYTFVTKSGAIVTVV